MILHPCHIWVHLCVHNENLVSNSVDLWNSYFVFQYCSQTPKMHVCRRGEPAYLFASLLNPKNYKTLGVKNVLHCFCPAPRTHINLRTLSQEDGETLVIGSLLSCDLVSCLTIFNFFLNLSHALFFSVAASYVWGNRSM